MDVRPKTSSTGVEYRQKFTPAAMRLPRDAAAPVLAVRQRLGDLLPESYCMPQCPQCKSELQSFNPIADCVPNSSFITNCGACQSCISMNAIENPETTNAQLLEADMIVVLNLCADTAASAAVQAYQSQAAKISQIGDQLASLASKSATASSRVTTSPLAVTVIQSASDPVRTSSPGAAAYLSELTTASGNTALLPTATPFSQVNTSASPPNPPASMHRLWILGPIIGSILGLATIVAVIMFVKHKQRLEQRAQASKKEEAAKEFPDDASSHSDQGKAQLHADCMPAKELDSSEIQAPVELPASEPPCSELNTPREGTMDPEAWPLQTKMPLSPLPWMFAEVELRDKREERSRSSSPKRHDTFYHA